MGDFEVRLPNQGFQSEEQSPLSWPGEAANPAPRDVPPENWRVSEGLTRRIVWTIQPTKASEKRRRMVVDYVQRLIKNCLGCEVFPFGSVPLKTYLPDGDIDLTALASPNGEDVLSGEVHAVLEGKERNNFSEFEVKDVQYIHAEVKLVKCLVQNIVVDISFNQIGGLCTLCFLDQVDNIIGKDHLFKRTILLIKAWCYYESRILGAHHSLISTYALETLVLYIFNFFHSSLDGPLEVLYRFLDYFSKFDWDSFCISLRGPVRLSSLPEILAEMPEADGGELLLSNEFLNKCGEKFSTTPRIMENNHRAFVKKYLNIVDPLRENNNLGRSVSKGNLYRIRSAFAYGARKLGKILLLPRESMSNELNKFFKNTLERHGRGERPDVQDAHLDNSDSSRFDLNEFANVLPDIDIKKDGELRILTSFNDVKENGHGLESQIPTSDYLFEGKHARIYTTREGDVIEGDAGPPSHLAGDIDDPIIGKASSSRITCERNTSSTSTETSSTTRAHHAPHMFFHTDNGRSMREDANRSTKADPDMTYRESPETFNEFELSCNRSHPFSRHRAAGSMSNGECIMSNGVVELTAKCPMLGDDNVTNSNSGEVGLTTEDRALDAYDLADLSGNHEVHYNNLNYAQQAHDIFLSRSVSHGNLSTSHYAFCGPMYQHANGFIPSAPFPRPPNFYPMNRGFIPGSYGLEDMPKPRGTGTYFPNTNHRSHKDKPSVGRGRNQFLPSHVAKSRNNGRVVMPPESNLTEVGVYPAPTGNGHGKPGQLEFSQPPNPPTRELSQANGSMSPRELEFGTFGPVPLSTIPTEPHRNLEVEDPHSNSSRSPVSSPTLQRPGVNHERLARSYRLKDDDEFPPLSGRGNQNITVHSNEHKPAWEARR